MLKESLKVAVYSGVVPSTTFIERLIIGLSKKSFKVFVFGYYKRKIKYDSSISIIAYKDNKIQKTYHFIKYSLLLFFFKNKDKTKLDAILRSNRKNILLAKVKCYPVLWHQPDIFHVQWAKGLSDWVWVQDFGIKLVLSLRGAHINYSPIADSKLAKMYQDNFPKVDGFHAVSKAIALEAEKYLAVKEKIKVVYSGLDMSLFHNTTKKNASEVFEIISVGRKHWKKGYVYAIDACKILKDHNINFKYTIVGANTDIELAYQIYDLDLSEYVELLDQLSFNEVQNRIKYSDLILLPSVEEGVANVVLEAMALNTLVLTTNCGGMTEVVTDGENGFIIPIRDSKKMAHKIIDISNMTHLEYEKFTQKAYKTILSQHNEEVMVEGMLELYNSI